MENIEKSSEEKIAIATANAFEKNVKYEHNILSRVRNTPYRLVPLPKSVTMSSLLVRHSEELKELDVYEEKKEMLKSALYLMGVEEETDEERRDRMFENALDLVTEPSSAKEFLSDPYFLFVHGYKTKKGNCELTTETVKNDCVWFNGCHMDKYLTAPMTPELISFDKDLINVPCFIRKDNGMLKKSFVTPFQIRQAKKAVKNATGDILVFGAGLSYFVFLAAQKKEVTSITVVDDDEDAIQLFKRGVCTQIPNSDKIMSFSDDMFDYARSVFRSDYNFCYVDMFPGRKRGYLDAFALEGILAMKNIKHMNYYSDVILYYSAYCAFLNASSDLGEEERAERQKYIDSILGEEKSELIERLEKRNRGDRSNIARAAIHRDGFINELFGRNYIELKRLLD